MSRASHCDLDEKFERTKEQQLPGTTSGGDTGLSDASLIASGIGLSLGAGKRLG
jgi:hypothetical protein